MVQRKEASENAIQSSTEVHKSSGIAVQKAKWYIAECKQTRERTLRTMLRKAGYEAYVATQTETHVYKSRNRREVEKVIIPCRVFIRTEVERLADIMVEYSSLYRFMLNKAATLNEYGHKPFAFVPDSQMQQLQYVLGQAENPVFITAEELKPEQKVRVMRGPLAGIEGGFWKKGTATYIVIKVEMGVSNYVYTEVQLDDVQLVKS